MKKQKTQKTLSGTKMWHNNPQKPILVEWKWSPRGGTVTNS